MPRVADRDEMRQLLARWITEHDEAGRSLGHWAIEIDATLDTFAPLHPLGRVGTPADVANAVTYLLSDQASWVTGAILMSTAASWPAATNPMGVPGGRKPARNILARWTIDRALS